jgi:organic radical activating enzyme
MEELDSKFCLVPFTSFSISPRGIIRTCCNQYERNMHTEWENVKDAGDKISWPTPRLVEIQEIMRGSDIEEKTPLCKMCWNSEKIGSPSYRTMYNDFMLEKVGIDKVKELKNNPHINVLDLQFGHLCNNSCVMCNTSLSSHLYTTKSRLAKMSTAPEQKAYYETDLTYINDHSDWTLLDKSYNKVVDLSKPVTEVKLSGGEPLFNPRFKGFLNHLVTKELPISRLHLTTNGTIYDDEISGLINKVKDIVHLKLSVEAIGNKEEFIRWPTNWKEKEKNIRSFISNINTPPTIKIEISTCIQSLNLFAMTDIAAFVKELQKEFPNKLIVQNRQPVLWTDLASLSNCDNDYLNHYLTTTDLVSRHADVIKQVHIAMSHDEKKTKMQLQYYMDLAKLQQKNLEEIFPIYWYYHKKYL